VDVESINEEQYALTMNKMKGEDSSAALFTSQGQ